MPSPRHLEIARRLSTTIPAPAKPSPKARATWEGCRALDQLAALEGVEGVQNVPLLRVVEVTSCDSDGLWVRRIAPSKSAISSRLSSLEGWRKLKKKERL